jgi:hypothetical protein
MKDHSRFPTTAIVLLCIIALACIGSCRAAGRVADAVEGARPGRYLP